ncbi:MAG: Stp1/IreP family PP2C-type Ser/Thr phosphatase [Clostridia bacterium]|nr:Stp1/IreP family PP2C-type Ser/Thr phosphatase [Clostridia bacterium]
MISVGFKTDKGMLRKGNEDALFVLPDQQLYIVADGVGGHNSGELASRMAVGYIAQYAALNPVDQVQSKRELRQYFQTCFDGANELIYQKAKSEPDNSGMATTCVLCYLRGSSAYVVNVGDSRAYLLRDGVLRQITEDHTCVQVMLKEGIISKEEAAVHPDRNMITRAIGGDSKVEADFFQFDIFSGDVIILCTDGLYGEVGDESMLGLAARTESMHRLANNLVDEANYNGGKDNISVVCIKIQ